MSQVDSDDEIIAVARAGFLDEAQEMLAQFEQALLVMESDPADRENLNAAFRAAHTIKGSAGLFGFDAVVAFTHEVETLLESLRSGELAVNETLAALLLQSRDQMERLLEEVRSGTSDPAIAATSHTLGEQLRNARGAGGAAAPVAEVAEAESEFIAEAAAGLWHLSLRFTRDALRNGLDPLAFIRYLSNVGQVHGIRTLHEAVPSLEELDAETCYLGFEIRLESEAGRDAIADVFEFCADDSDIAILAPDADAAEYEALLQRRCVAAHEREALQAVWTELGVQPAQAAASAPAADAAEAAVGAEAAVPQAVATAVAEVVAAATIPERRDSDGGDRRQTTRDRRAGGEETRFIRVRADKLDRLIDLIGELVIASSGAQLVAQTEQSPSFAEAALRIHDLVQEARDGALGLRMVPIGETFTRFQRVVRDVSKQLGKEVELQITGGDTELDKSMVETITDPLMHLVRNSLDHGIEMPDERVAAGKHAQGRLALHAYHESGSIMIEVSDDGKGLNRERILAKGIERGLVAPDAVLDDDAIHQLIFAPGFSTAAAVTNLSGRGVGMDVVKRNIESLRGQIRIASQPGRGATMQIRLPLTLAIIDGFLTSVGGVSYVLPLELVAECLEVPPEYHADPSRVAGHFDLRGELLPYLDIGRFYRHAAPAANARRSLLLVRDGSSRIGLIVDRLHGEHQTVIKPLGEVFRHIRGLAGSTILGSGEVALILDVPALLALATDNSAGRPKAIANGSSPSSVSSPLGAGSAH